ncbi:tyrosine-type recombinase/integrase, partial [Escherichia coli]
CQTSTLRRSGLLLSPTCCRSELQHPVSPQEDRFLVGQRIRQNSRTKKVLYCLLLVCLLCLPDSGKRLYLIWVNFFYLIPIQEDRLQHNELRPNSYRQKGKPIRLFREHCGMQHLKDITALDIAEIIDAVKAEGHNRMAQVVRMVLIDVFKEAQHAGHVPPGFNPAQATKQPRNRVNRQRLSLPEWQAIFDSVSRRQPYLKCGMLLALVTGQRLSDICNLKFSDIWDDMLHITQEKTGSKLAIPLNLKCDALNITLREVISQCRDAFVSKYLVHYRHTTSQANRGDQVSANTLTTAFKKAREKCGIKWEQGTAPTFHEQRSLSERLYREQGLDTQKLLGHKSRKMTDRYNDDRGKDWIIVDIKTA